MDHFFYFVNSYAKTGNENRTLYLDTVDRVGFFAIENIRYDFEYYEEYRNRPLNTDNLKNFENYIETYKIHIILRDDYIRVMKDITERNLGGYMAILKNENIIMIVKIDEIIHNGIMIIDNLDKAQSLLFIDLIEKYYAELFMKRETFWEKLGRVLSGS